MKKLILICCCVLSLQCAVDRTILPATDAEFISLEQFQTLEEANKVTIANEKEPGVPLMLCLTFLDKGSREVLANQSVSFYHATTDGEYEPSTPNDETTARLSGTATTNEFGNIYVETILPGDYGSSENNRHIHTTVHGARPYAYDIFFKQYSRRVGRFMDSGNEQMFFANLKSVPYNKLVCFVTIEAKNAKAEESY